MRCYHVKVRRDFSQGKFILGSCLWSHVPARVFFADFRILEIDPATTHLEFNYKRANTVFKPCFLSLFIPFIPIQAVEHPLLKY